MIGIGPFIPHQDTPFKEEPAGTSELTMFMIGILRLLFPKALIPAMTADSVMRLVKGSMKEASLQEESFEQELLEYPQYPRPADYKGEKVPEVLLSGNHEAILDWRRKEALRVTREQRLDLMQ